MQIVATCPIFRTSVASLSNARYLYEEWSGEGEAERAKERWAAWSAVRALALTATIQVSRYW